MTNLYIPKKIHVGFNNRSDTYTGKLGYVIYEDDKGVLRKETSWNSWRDKNIDAVSFDNTPHPNFVFNRGIQRGGWDWYSKGRSVIRVYDPRDFEFEITVDNLIGLLMHSDVSKRDIVEECVYAWAGKELVLLPVNSQDYIDAVAYTNKQSQKVSTKELVKGFTYSKKKEDGDFVYLGFYPWFDYLKTTSRWSRDKYGLIGKKHVFYDKKTGRFDTSSPSTFASCVSAEVDQDFPNLVDKFIASRHSSNVVKFEVRGDPDSTNTHNYYSYNFKVVGDTVYKISYNSYNKEVSSGSIVSQSCTITDNCALSSFNFNVDYEDAQALQKEFGIQIFESSGLYSYRWHSRPDILIPNENLEKFMSDKGFGKELVAITENGCIFKFGGY